MEPTIYVMKTKVNRLAHSLHATARPSVNSEPRESLTKSGHSDFVRVFLLLKFKSSNPDYLHPNGLSLLILRTRAAAGSSFSSPSNQSTHQQAPAAEWEHGNG